MASEEFVPVITSLLDTDLYKITMQAAVLGNFSDAQVEYGFTNRTPEKKFTRASLEWLQKQVRHLGTLRFSPTEIEYLRTTVKCLPETYLKFLETFKLVPEEEVDIKFFSDNNEDGTAAEEGHIVINVKGSWAQTILYEIPLLALVSEGYFKFVDTNWTLDGQVDLAAHKAAQLFEAGCTFSEFGTRRRRSFATQDLVIQGIVRAATANHTQPKNPLLIGTSNVLLAQRYGLTPIGTVAHEWMMGIAAYTQDYVNANRISMDTWIKTVGPDAAGFALTDTFGTEDFLKAFVPPYSDYYLGVRQDSGDPLVYTKLIANHYEKLGYARGTKKIIFSDSLDINKCKIYKAAAEAAGLVPSFGIGTFFTNDFINLRTGTKSTPLNIVIKIAAVNGHPAIKISDNASKNTGDPATVRAVKAELGYTEREWSEADESKRWDA
ncbi:similar to Saccharomyces cerevisiae YOR209C NPT1 Nicotinate phosphoribosyltransferase, acts in the salvage pathway of NAD+ biosynthesis [Geotrichum candidum]|uniref:Nicotinate phosphoribosyltransferase n=1 Tax=Geotrichum candidum TaxID=1173061 RepID=A0A0J9X9T3_GEOCN|nr:similar to Saccharomyces cerevisiae YOR209C NPT1 Nicotinate phosphoribosyltransferase, acts in the salvage pathway of NAD+ biosynthesis [Geotrichum candidum]